jgi:hypothetical protein
MPNSYCDPSLPHAADQHNGKAVQVSMGNDPKPPSPFDTPHEGEPAGLLSHDNVMGQGGAGPRLINDSHTDTHWGCAFLAWLVNDCQPGSYRRTAAAYWDHEKQRMRLEYSVIVSVHLPDCLAGFDSGTLVAYGDSLPELRAIAEREMPLLVAAIERRVKLAMGDDSVPPCSIRGDV